MTCIPRSALRGLCARPRYPGVKDEFQEEEDEEEEEGLFKANAMN